jgi:hypothetical protein
VDRQEEQLHAAIAQITPGGRPHGVARQVM